MNPSKHSLTVLAQIFKLIPGNLISKLANKYGVTKKSRSFTPTSHIATLIFAHLSHAISLNDVCDSLKNHSGALSCVRGSVAPSKNALSHANRERNADMAEALFWSVLNHLTETFPEFANGRNYCGIPRRFRRTIFVVDSSTIRLVANCLDWARHRRRKAAAKIHLRLDLQTFLPRFVLVKSAGTNDLIESYELCADVKAGEIVVFDKAYAGYEHLNILNERNVFWVTRLKENAKYETVGQHRVTKGEIIRDVDIRMTDPKTSRKYPGTLRLVEAIVQVDNKPKEMAFITNNMQWAASSICDLYKSRWGIEAFFKEIKQTLQLADFLGHNENAVRWQVWTALLTYVLLRFIAWQSKWKHSFTRLFTVLRGVLWSCLDLFSVLSCCGTASGTLRIRAAPEQCYLPGFSPS
ncbi:MAG: IS4 family transposase [Armatimonadetes bacterium]|nr:IS4 family transposase [Armatimonadota bacterium]